MAFSDPQRNIEQLGLSEGMRVADFGAGSGFYTVAASGKVGMDGRVYAIDIQSGLLGRIQDTVHGVQTSNIEVLQGDLEHEGGSKLRDGTADVVLAANILFQVTRKEVFLKEAWRVLKSGGRLLLVDWRGAFGGVGPRQRDVVAETAAEQLLRNAGFSIERRIQAGEHHYGIVARRPKGA
ncbi:methyltransferase domain-containing protein [Candidatus Wolfebacteria bacterium]|nr:methyltransferase domain-containing protein [Candidatus Wolfebacteria bacterium]